MTDIGNISGPLVEGLGAAEHSHHWLIGKQDGPASEGTCKTCGAVQSFTNGFTRSFPPRVTRPFRSTAAPGE